MRASEPRSKPRGAELTGWPGRSRLNRDGWEEREEEAGLLLLSQFVVQ